MRIAMKYSFGSCRIQIWFGLALVIALPTPILAADDKEEILALHKRADAAFDAGKYKQAAVDWERALQISKRIAGPDHALTMDLEGVLGKTYLELGQYAKAEPLLFRGLRLHERQYGKASWQVATDLSVIAGLYGKKGDLRQAKVFYEKSIKTWEAVPTHKEATWR